MRLVLIQKPPDVAARARARAQRASRKDQRQRTHPLTLEAADHLILITSLPREAFPIERLGALYRLRWQVELAFKRMKSLLRIDRLPAKSDALASAWLHAHLLFALLVEASADETGDFPPETQPESGSPRAPSLWRVVALLARRLIAAIWPPTGFRKAKIRLAKDPRLREPPRKRKLQMTAFALS